MQHILALSRTAVVVRHWFEIDLDDASVEHGVRIEVRERRLIHAEVASRPRNSWSWTGRCGALTYLIV